jgi:hypothetical protein
MRRSAFILLAFLLILGSPGKKATTDPSESSFVDRYMERVTQITLEL